MSYRLPVVTSAIPANLEVGLPAECYHQVGDVKALAAKLKAIVMQPLQRIDYDMSKYDWDEIAGQVSGIYESLA
jgi:glycosyltransferase involved in cell wall biosynthesis